MPDEARWFDALGACACGCGKRANGTLRGPRNDSYGHYDFRCAMKRLRKAELERAKQTGTAGRSQ